MASHTTYKVGGAAAAFVEADDEGSLRELLVTLDRAKVPFIVLGNGSNVLFADAGFAGVVIHLGQGFGEIECTRDHHGAGQHRLEVGGAASVTKLLRVTKELEVAGVEFLGGVPGTLGGAVRMNAGTVMGEVSDSLESARVLTPDGEARWIAAEDLQLSYRRSVLPRGAIVVGARFHTRDADPAMRSRLAEVLAYRKSTQPLQYPSCGSVFANPQGDHAGMVSLGVGEHRAAARVLQGLRRLAIGEHLREPRAHGRVRVAGVESSADHDGSTGQDAAPVGELEILGRDPSGLAVRRQHAGRLQTIADLAHHRAGVHAHSAAERPRDSAEELNPSDLELLGHAQQLRDGGRPPDLESVLASAMVVAGALDLTKPLAEMDHHAGEPGVREEDVGAVAQDDEWDLRAVEGHQQLAQRTLVIGLHEGRGGAAHLVGGVGRHGLVVANDETIERGQKSWEVKGHAASSSR